jgi:SAM-dependent methyltransferase
MEQARSDHVNLISIVERANPLEPWSEGEKIPWDEPGFSERMLAEHLSQAHDGASRRTSIIAQQVAWVHEQVLSGRPSMILDLGCGPGLYLARLAALGHRSTGIDFSPASIRHAQQIAEESGLTIDYRLGDIRGVDFGDGYDLVMLLYGELNVFRPADARLILSKARRALQPDGRLVLEVHSPDAVRALGLQPNSWRAVERGLFSERPYLLLEESFWDAAQQVATTRYYVVDAATAEVTRYAASTQLYNADTYRELLTGNGFAVRQLGGTLTGSDDEGAFIVLLADAV